MDLLTGIKEGHGKCLQKTNLDIAAASCVGPGLMIASEVRVELVKGTSGTDAAIASQTDV